MLDAPFKIGETYWRAASGNRQVTVECPMCCGQKYVTVTLGNGEQYTVDCEACGAGFEGPRGVVQQYDRTPLAEPFEIVKIKEWREDRWLVANPTNLTAYFDTLYATEAEALAASEKRAADLMDSNMASLRKKKYGKVSSWNIRYHKRQIKEYQKKIAWHQSKIYTKEEE